MPGEIDVTRHVKDALKNLWDLSRLQVHPLLEMIAIPRLPYETAGETLHRQLRDAVDMLRPPASLGACRKEWVNYRLLRLLYVETMGRRDVQRELCLSERTFYRRHREAIEAVASILRERRRIGGIPGDRYVAPSEKATTGQEPAWPESDRQIAPRCPAASLHDTLAKVFDTIRPLFVEQACSLLADAPQELPETGEEAAALRQIMADALLGALVAARPKALTMQVTRRDSAGNRRGNGLRDAAPSSEMLAVSMIDSALAD